MSKPKIECEWTIDEDSKTGEVHYVCDWCPNKPRFATMSDLGEHFLSFGYNKYDHLRKFYYLYPWKRSGEPSERAKEEKFVKAKLPLFKDGMWKTADKEN